MGPAASLPPATCREFLKKHTTIFPGELTFQLKIELKGETKKNYLISLLEKRGVLLWKLSHLSVYYSDKFLTIFLKVIFKVEILTSF